MLFYPTFDRKRIVLKNNCRGVSAKIEFEEKTELEKQILEIVSDLEKIKSAEIMVGYEISEVLQRLNICLKDSVVRKNLEKFFEIKLLLKTLLNKFASTNFTVDTEGSFSIIAHLLIKKLTEITGLLEKYESFLNTGKELLAYLQILQNRQSDYSFGEFANVNRMAIELLVINLHEYKNLANRYIEEIVSQIGLTKLLFGLESLLLTIFRSDLDPINYVFAKKFILKVFQKLKNNLDQDSCLQIESSIDNNFLSTMISMNEDELIPALNIIFAYLVGRHIGISSTDLIAIKETVKRLSFTGVNSIEEIVINCLQAINIITIIKENNPAQI